MEKESRVQSGDNGLLHRFGFRKNIRISNFSNKKAYVIITPTPIISISTIGVEKLGNIQYEQHGDYQSQELMILPSSVKYFDLQTSKVYISILIEVENCNWLQWRKNRLINSNTTDYNITKYAEEECINTSFLDYSRK
jgi:hypothetical protein